MTPSEWPLRFVPRRATPIWQAVLVTLLSFAGAIAIRGLMLGFDNATGLSATYFPAFIVATLYAGPRWGWATLSAALLIGAFGASNIPASVSREAIIVIYGLSGAITVMVAGALREAILRLDEAKATE